MSEPANMGPGPGAVPAGVEDVVDVRQIMAGIRLRVREARAREEETRRRARQFVSTELVSGIGGLSIRARAIRQSAARVGEPPPQPPTTRGRIGGLAVRLIHRALFWLIPPLREAHEQMALALAEQARVNEELLQSLERASIRIGVLEAAWKRIEGGDGE